MADEFAQSYRLTLMKGKKGSSWPCNNLLPLPGTFKKLVMNRARILAFTYRAMR